MAQKTIDGVIGLTGQKAVNFISQINDGTTTHDITVKSGITFFPGVSGDGIVWDGTQPIEVVIPSIADIIQNPVRLMGTVGSDGNLPAGLTPTKGDLLYITEDCSFAGTNPTTACEAGDMAIYDGISWHVIQGENQVTIVGTPTNNVVSVALSGTAQNVLNVEGKQLALGIDYSDVRSKVSFTTNGSNTISVEDGTVTVPATYVALSYVAGQSDDITTSMSIDLPTSLADGTVTIGQNVLEASNFVFSSGSFPTISKNADAISINVSHNMSVVASGEGSFVTDVTAIKGVTFAAGTAVDKDFGFVASLSSIAGTSFISGMHVKASDEQAATDLTIWGEASVATSTFVSGLSAASDSGDLVSAITVGTVSLDATGSGILTGLSTDGNDVVTSVSVGYAALDNEAQWFLTGVNTTGTDVVTDVTVGAVSLVSSSDNSFVGSAITSASVSNHVLTFSTGSFMTPVAISQVSSTISKGGFNKSGVKISGTSIISKGFTTASLSQAATSVSFKSVLFDNVTLSQASTAYVFDKEQDHNYDVVMGYVKATPVSADVTKNGAKIENGITATIPANSVAVDVTGGTLPSLTVNEATGTLTATVGTSLSTSNVSWLAVDASKKSIAGEGTYTLVSDSSVAGALTVGASGTYDLKNGEVTITEDTYIIDILVDGTSVSVSA